MAFFIGLAAALLTAIAVLIAAGRAQDRQEARLARWLESVAIRQEPLLFTPDGELDRRKAEELVHWAGQMVPEIRLYVLSPRGILVSGPLGDGAGDDDKNGTNKGPDPQRDGESTPRVVSIREVRSAVEGRAGPAPWSGDDPRGGRGTFYAEAVASGRAAPSYLYAVVRSRSEDPQLGQPPSAPTRPSQAFQGPERSTAAGAGEPSREIRSFHPAEPWILAVGGGLLVGSSVALMVGVGLHRRRRRWELRLGSALRMAEQLESTFHSGPRPFPSPLEPRQPLIARLEEILQGVTSHLEEALAQIDAQGRAHRELMANAAHDLRTPLASLRGYLETLSLPPESLDEKKRQEYLAIALRQSERLSRLVQDLFDLSRLEGQPKPVLERFHLGELVQDNVQRLRLRAERSGIDLGAEFDSGLPPVYADVGLMERALQNLLDNALRHTGPGGRVTVLLRESEGRLLVAVRDTGAGIAEEDLPHIFERFYRSKGKQASRTGAGFGLAIAALIAELHGGSLQVDSVLGQGSTFRFDLAIAPRTQALGEP